MRAAFDRRVLPTSVLELVRSCQSRGSVHLGGGAALAGAYLAHRTTGDVDLFCHGREAMRELARVLPEIAEAVGGKLDILRDAGHLVRARFTAGQVVTEVDLAYEPIADLEPPPPPLEGVVVESLTDLRASKLTCILSRSEPRDLVDLFFLDRAGFPPEEDLGLALRKDAGIDPGVIAWLLSRFPTRPLPQMLEPLDPAELELFREDLAARFGSTLGL